MGYDISFNETEFNGKVESFENAIADIESKMSKGETLDKTNLKPFVKDLENLVRTLEILEKYRDMLQQDITGIKNIGEGLKNQDAALSRQDTSGNQAVGS